VTVIVPSLYSGVSLRRKLSLKKGLINVRFMVISRLAEYLGSPILAAKGKSPLSSLFESAAIQHVAEKMSAQQPLGVIAKNSRLQKSLLTAFQELDVLSPNSLEKLAAFDPLRLQVVNWYRDVRELTARYYTREEITREAAAGLDQPVATVALSDLGAVIFYLVSDLSPAETGLIAGLYAAGRSALVLGITGEKEVDARLNGLLLKLDPGYSLDSSPATHLASPVKQMVIAHNYQEEVKWVVRHILSQAQNKIPFHRTAVLYHNSYPYADYILHQLKTAGIPSAGPATGLLKDTPPGKFVIHLLDVINNGFARDAVMHWIAEAPVRAVPANVSAQAELANWEMISRKAGIVKGRDQWLQRLEAYRNRLAYKIENLDISEETSPSEMNGLKEEARSVEALLILIKRLVSISVPKSRSSHSTFTEWLLGLIDQYTYGPASWPEDRQKVLERVKELIGQIGSLDDLIPGGTTLDEFTSLMGNALEITTGRSGITGEGVFVGPVSSVTGMNFETVYITGMSEGAFPPRPHIDPLLPDEVRQLPDISAVLPLSTERNLKERRHYLNALGAGRTCILAFCQTDASAQRGQYPSPWFLNELGKLNGTPLDSAEIEKLDDKPWLSVIRSSEHALRFAGVLTPLDIHDYDMFSLNRWRTGKRFTAPHFLLSENTAAGRAIKMEEARRGYEFSAWDGNLSSLAGRSRLMGLPGCSHFSPTRLEKWAGCPMSYFLGHVLEIPVYEKPEENIIIQAKDRGSLVHRILERFFRPLVESGQVPDGGVPWDNRHEAQLIEIAHQEFERLEQEGITGHPLMWKMTMEEIEQDLVAFLTEDSELRATGGLKPVYLEQSFGMERQGGLPAVRLQVNNREINLHGFIDRVDSNPDGSKFMIIDYKTGGSSAYYAMKKTPLDGGRRLQLPVYAMAVRQGFGAQSEITACYWFVSTKGKFERREITLSAVEKPFIETVQLIAAGIEGGLFPSNPGKDGKENCRYCDFDRICSPDRDLMWEKKSAAPELERYVNLVNCEPAEEDNE